MRPLSQLSLVRRIRQNARPPLVLLRLLIINQLLTILTESPRLVMGNLDNSEVGGAFAEDAVHFFKGPTCSFRVEEVHDGEDEGVAILCQPVSTGNRGSE